MIATLVVGVLSARAVVAATHPRSAADGAVVPSAYQAAAMAKGIPPRLLWAVALQESGWVRGARVVPWPWTLNVAGVPARYANRGRACVALHRALKEVSARRIDIGLTQVNWGYHRESLHSPCELLDPYRNLAFASRLLADLHQEGESWVSTAARYHRPAGGTEATRYGASVQARLARLERADRRKPLQSSTPSTVTDLRP